MPLLNINLDTTKPTGNIIRVVSHKNSDEERVKEGGIAGNRNSEMKDGNTHDEENILSVENGMIHNEEVAESGKNTVDSSTESNDEGGVVDKENNEEDESENGSKEVIDDRDSTVSLSGR